MIELKNDLRRTEIRKWRQRLEWNGMLFFGKSRANYKALSITNDKVGNL